MLCIDGTRTINSRNMYLLASAISAINISELGFDYPYIPHIKIIIVIYYYYQL